MKRRRFLAISAASIALPGAALALPYRWRGRALGAEAEIILHGPPAEARHALSEVETILRQIEATFSLYNTGSEISRLNAMGTIRMSDWFAHIVALSSNLNEVTEGLFDPTIQPVWRALFEGQRPAHTDIGWHRVEIEGRHIRLQPGQALTFNGIAQGFATDLVSQALRARGFGEILVNLGEFAGFGRAWQIGLSDPVHGHLGTRSLTGGAIATSSPGALDLQGKGHILHPLGHAPQWSTVSVEAETAAWADGLSTALCLADSQLLQQVVENLAVLRRVTTVSEEGNLRTFS